jgi:hypothetical protein
VLAPEFAGFGEAVAAGDDCAVLEEAVPGFAVSAQQPVPSLIRTGGESGDGQPDDKTLQHDDGSLRLTIFR